MSAVSWLTPKISSWTELQSRSIRYVWSNLSYNHLANCIVRNVKQHQPRCAISARDYKRNSATTRHWMPRLRVWNVTWTKLNANAIHWHSHLRVRFATKTLPKKERWALTVATFYVSRVNSWSAQGQSINDYARSVDKSSPLLDHSKDWASFANQQWHTIFSHLTPPPEISFKRICFFVHLCKFTWLWIRKQRKHKKGGVDFQLRSQTMPQ